MEEYWLKKAEKAYENDPTQANWDKFVWEVNALKSRHELDLAEAQEHLARLERLIPDMEHKKKNRETYQTRSR